MRRVRPRFGQRFGDAEREREQPHDGSDILCLARESPRGCRLSVKWAGGGIDLSDWFFDE